MASGFHYSCSQFLSALQFPSLSTQVQEVARQLRDTSISSEDVSSVTESTSSSRPDPSHALKLFLSGCECTEFGAVESSCWGLRRLYEADFFSANDLITQLQTKLPTCPHPTPLLSLLADLLLSEHSHSEYNLHTHQHPLALAFFHCPDSVICVISSLLTKHHTLQPLRMLWPCLVHLLIHPQLSHHRVSLSSALLEVASVSSRTDSLAFSLLRLLLLPLVCSTENTDSILLAVLDFSLSSPALAPLSDVISFSYNLLLHCSAHTICSLLFHKLERLFTIQPDLIFHPDTIPWLSLSLLSSFLTPLASQLSDIVQLVVETYQHESVSDTLQDSLSLLLLPLLGSQLCLQLIRPDVASKYSLLLRSLLPAAKRSQRGRCTIGELPPASSLFWDVGVYPGDLCLFSFLSRSLLVCSISLLDTWCGDTTILLSKVKAGNQSPPLLSCIACCLLIEFTSSHNSADASSSARILQLLLQLITHLVRTTHSLSPALIACLMLAMDRCPYPEGTALTLHSLSSLSTHPACTILLLRSLLSLSDTPSLLPPLLRALVSLWKQHDAIFPHLKQLIQLHTPSSPDWFLARALSILDVCQTRASVHGEEMLPLVSDLINSRNSPLFICLGLSALASLVEAGVVEYALSLRLFYASVGDHPPAHWEAPIALRATQLLRLSLTQLEPARDHELLCKCVQQQLALLAHSEEAVQVAAISTLSETSPQELILLEPFSPSLRSLLSLPECLDLSPDRRDRSLCGALCSFVLRIYFTPHSECEGCFSLSQFLSRWLEDELSSCSSVFPREHKQEADRGEAALRSTAKLLTAPLPKQTHLTEISDFPLSSHNAVSILFLGRELWDGSATPEYLCQQYLKLLARSLLFTPRAAPLTPSDINSFLVFIHGLKLFMCDVISSITLSSPFESLFPLLDQLTCARNPQGVMWLMVGLALNVRELHSSGLQAFIQSLINSLISASTHLLPPSDSYLPVSAAQTMSFSQDLSAISEVAYLGLGVLGGVMVAHLKQNFSASTLNLYIRVWNSSQHSSHQLDALYALTLSAVLLARDAYLLEEGPSYRKLAELSKRCTLQIQESRFPSQFAYLLLTHDVTLIRSKQQESFRALTAQDSGQSLEVEAMNCSVLTCRLYSRREMSLQQCDQVISTFLKLSSQPLPSSCIPSAAGILLSHTAFHGHVASQLLIPKYLSQLKTLLQQAQCNQFTIISSLLLGIFALFGAFQPIFGDHPYPCPPTPSHYSVLQQSVRTLLDHVSPKIDKNSNFSHSLHLLGFIYRHYSLFSETIRTPSSSNHLPDNIILMPLLSFIEQSLYSGNIYREFQQKKFETIFEVFSKVRKPLPPYPWTNLITCFLRSSEHDGLHSSLLRLLFRLQGQATEQERQQIRYILRYWILDPSIDLDRIGDKSRKIVVDNLSGLFDSTADSLALKRLLLFLLKDSDLFTDILKGLIKMLREQDTEGVRTFERILLNTSLEQMLKPPLSSRLYKPEFIHLLDKCLSKLSTNDTQRLVPLEGEPFLLLRVCLFVDSHEFAWLRPCIPYLLGQFPLTCIPSSPLQDMLIQLSRIRTLPFGKLSQVCLEVINIAKSLLQNRMESAPTKLPEECTILVFNTLYFLALVNPEISRTSGFLLLTPRKLLPHNTPLDSELSFCLSNMTHAAIAINAPRNETEELHTPIFKKLYEFLLIFYQFLDSCDFSDSILIATVFSFLIRIRRMDTVFASKPWALFGEAIFIQSKLFLK